MIDPNAIRTCERSDGIMDLHEAIKSGRIDRTAGLIRDVKLMGLESKNKRRYHIPNPALFEGVQVRIDHHGKEGRTDELLTDPSFKDIWATTQNITVSPEGVRGDLKYNPKHPWMESILWWAENTPTVGGFSPINWGLHSHQGDETIIDIVEVESIDLVDKPATTNGLYERENDTMDPKEVLKIQESLAAKTLEALNAVAKLAERDASIVTLTSERDAATKRANEAEGKLAAEAAAKLAAERRGSREKLIADAKLPEDIVTKEFREAVVNATSDETAKLLVETVSRAHGAPRSSTTSPDAALGQSDVVKAAESFDAAKAAGLFTYDKSPV